MFESLTKKKKKKVTLFISITKASIVIIIVPFLQVQGILSFVQWQQPRKLLKRQIFNFKKIVDGKMFNCKMTEEPTMATAEEAAQKTNF